jgi:4-hydroxybenzoate polyprenyltransferase
MISPMLKLIIKSMRPRQWPKNAFLLAALVFDQKLFDSYSLLRSLAGLVIFCILSGCVYIINDITDIEADRHHPTKCNRPIASGKLPIQWAVITAVSLLVITFTVSFLLSTGFGAICIAYFLINIAYSLWLKHIPLIDVFIIAAGFVLRVAAGVSLIHVERFSPWLYVAMSLLALYLGFGKRRAELAEISGDSASHRKVLDGYNLVFLDQLITIVSGTTIIVYSLYTFSAPNVPSNDAMMLTIPFVIYCIFRYLYLIQVKHQGGAPEELLLSDRPLQIAIALWGISVFVVFYIF